MKLIFCRNCQDVVRLFDFPRSCRCGMSSGMYLNDVAAVCHGSHVVPLGFDNLSLNEAIKDPPHRDDLLGKKFDAFVIPGGCRTFERLKGPRIGEKH